MLSVHLSVCLFCIVLCFTAFSVFNCLHFFANKEREREKCYFCRCSGTPTVRLVGSGVSHRGRLEVLHNGIWGTVCDDGFSDTDARVFCYQLGFG